MESYVHADSNPYAWDEFFFSRPKTIGPALIESKDRFKLRLPAYKKQI